MPRPKPSPLILDSVLIADGEDFVSRPVERAALVYGGIRGDLHAGPTRPACSRAPWHPRGTEIANTRQLSMVSLEECAEIAAKLDLPEVPPALLGANLVLKGMDDFSALPPATRLLFPSGATIFVTEENGPCMQPGAKLGKAYDRQHMQLTFVHAAKMRRGLVGLVEREGEVVAGDEVRVVLSPARRPDDHRPKGG